MRFASKEEVKAAFPLLGEIFAPGGRAVLLTINKITERCSVFSI